MNGYQVDTMEREALKLVGYSIVESLNNVLETRIVGTLREELAGRRQEIEHGAGSGIYLLQIYPQDGHWTPDVPFRHVIAVEVDAFGALPEGMIAHTLPRGRYAKFVHEGPESRIGETYAYINDAYGMRPIDIEYWPDIHALDDADSRIEIYVPSKE
ncbi:GyrI-like domain-containing protein [Paenibacillus glycinis]|uniref:AraC effector-binding domain-containing protein n=1 Tax=Paenibacillus glycinis TaxID=2697035 RepID=A0ABW9XPW7_9BACL|nr:GyrI-like domain-containing protein [Paenibacillus glycinis]NBD24665.1 hypothetical protein [Paenibacillus glycinis]